MSLPACLWEPIHSGLKSVWLGAQTRIWLQDAQGQLRDSVLQQYTALLHDLASSEILELPAGLAYLHDSSAVLLRGTLKVSGRTDGSSGAARPAQPAPLINHHC